jgi:hypothetical protein
MPGHSSNEFAQRGVFRNFLILKDILNFKPLIQIGFSANSASSPVRQACMGEYRCAESAIRNTMPSFRRRPQSSTLSVAWMPVLTGVTIRVSATNLRLGTLGTIHACLCPIVL